MSYTHIHTGSDIRNELMLWSWYLYTFWFTLKIILNWWMQNILNVASYIIGIMNQGWFHRCREGNIMSSKILKNTILKKQIIFLRRRGVVPMPPFHLIFTWMENVLYRCVLLKGTKVLSLIRVHKNELFKGFFYKTKGFFLCI